MALHQQDADPPPLREQGRTHRLHFAIHAALPIGTTLRVAAFGYQATYNNDPVDTEPKIATPEAGPQWLDVIPREYRRQLHDSIELYTTPETYPIWRTDRPVVTIDDGGGTATNEPLLYRYRYVAVTPGASIDWNALFEGESDAAEGEILEDAEVVGQGGGGEGEFPPVLFEVPPSWGDRTSQLSTYPHYRTRVLVKGTSDNSIMDLGNNEDTNMDVEDDGEEVTIDHWNVEDDASYQHFRDTMILKQREMETANTPLLNEDVDMITEDEKLENENNSIYIVCYHLPVILSRDAATSTWEACWAESLIAQTKQDGISSTRKTTWIGTVSNVPITMLADAKEREAVRTLLKGMDCIPVFFFDEDHTKEEERLLNDMYLGFCKQVLRPSFHNVDLLDLAMNGWGQRHRDTHRLDPVRACQVAAAEAKERKKSISGSNLQNLFAEARAAQETENIVSPPSSLGEQNQPSGGSSSDWDQRRLDNWWNAYIRVNETFARVVCNLVNGGDIVWVHDYHLSLLPRILREMRNEKNIAGHSVLKERVSAPTTIRGSDKPVRMIFFIHVPFPTSQVFRELEHGEALLEGMLHADLIGFHSFDHERHFLNAAKRILGLTYESLVGGLIGIQYRETKVVVTVSNVSIETDVVDVLLGDPKFAEDSGALRKKHSGRIIISNIAVVQRLSGITYTLMAYERLLSDYPVWQSKVVLLQRCLIPGESRVGEADTLREINWLVQRICNRFGPEVIDYEENFGSVLPIDQRLAIWTSSKVMLHTPIREGLNLFPMEFVYTHKVNPGIVIASEFSAVSSILNGALRVNPYDVQNFVTTIDKALSMPRAEREGRRDRDIDFVSTRPSGLWTRNVLRDLDDATLQQSANMEAVSSADKSLDAILARESELGLERLDLPALERAYANTKSRVIIVDYNGTLVAKEASLKYLKREILGTSGFKPSQITSLALQKLCSDQNNTVYIVSGDSQQNLESAIGNVPGLGLAASNGTCFADPPKGGQARVWQYLDYGLVWDEVKKAAMPIISKFTARTNGSFVKLSHCSIGWSYYSSDPEWGSLQATYLVAELAEALLSFDVRFVALKGIVEGNCDVLFVSHFLLFDSIFNKRFSITLLPPIQSFHVRLTKDTL